ncbi:MAG: hypothetical protein HW415_1270 [Deltaproteobacteria bacterium]|nr:hypothetical protein [Deltaproteobacteria bacterium]
MNKQILLLSALALFFAVGCGADKNSNDACLYETTMNLDKGNYDAVLASSCADSMQKGAAHFGKAGYDVKDVINRFSEAKTTTNDLDTYMNALTGKVTENTLTNLDSAKTEYSTIPSTSTHYKDAKFYISLVDAVKSLSLIKIVTDSTGLGSLMSGCDKNANGVPDDADATACALQTITSTPCGSGITKINDVSPLTFATKTATYRGLDFTVTGTGPTTASCPANYKKLLFPQGAGWAAAVTSNPTDGMCVGSDGLQWPCPIEQGGVPLDLVTAIDQSITSAISSMGQALPAGTATDVQQSITDIKTQACGTDLTCTSADIASYLQTL